MIIGLQLASMRLAQWIKHRRQSRGAEGAVAPHLQTRGGQAVSNAPPFRRLSGMMPASTEKKHRHIMLVKCVKYYQKCVKFACNYFIKFFSFWGTLSPEPRPPTGSLPLDPAGGLPSPRTPVVLPPSQTSFRRLWDKVRDVWVLSPCTGLDPMLCIEPCIPAQDWANLAQPSAAEITTLTAGLAMAKQGRQ